MQRLGFPNNGKPILVAVSSGVDSMVLASLLLESGYAVAIAHCNYQLRGIDSDADEVLVENWCSKQNIPFHLNKVQTKQLTEDSTSSIQMVAREERYSFFEKLMDEYDYPATALAHHANDRVESLLMNVLRGTGFRGFQGMPAKRDNYVRPLLGFTKEEIREYAKLKNVPFREDASNQKTHYQRNWVRLRLLPMLRAYDESSFDKLIGFAEWAESEYRNYETWVEQQRGEITTENGISIEKLQQSNAPFTLLKELLEPTGFNSGRVSEVMDIVDSNSGAEVLSESHRVLKNRDELLISELNEKEHKPTLRFETMGRGELKSLKTESNVALLDMSSVGAYGNTSETKTSVTEFPNFQLRKWKQGDKFKPLGMNGWKLLSDFFIDQKLSVIQKNKVWLLTCRGEIVWVVGMRLDNRFKVTDSTQKVLKISAEI